MMRFVLNNERNPLGHTQLHMQLGGPPGVNLPRRTKSKSVRHALSDSPVESRGCASRGRSLIPPLSNLISTGDAYAGRG